MTSASKSSPATLVACVIFRLPTSSASSGPPCPSVRAEGDVWKTAQGRVLRNPVSVAVTVVIPALMRSQVAPLKPCILAEVYWAFLVLLSASAPAAWTSPPAVLLLLEDPPPPPTRT